MYVYRCIHGEVSWRLPLHGGFMLSFHHLVWKNRKHLKDENNIALLQFSEISDLVRRVCKTIEIQSEWIKNDRMTRYQEVVMILIGSMAFRVSNEDGSRKFATLARDWHPPNHVSCFFGWKQVEARHYAIWYTIYIYILCYLIYDIYIYTLLLAANIYSHNFEDDFPMIFLYIPIGGMYWFVLEERF